MINCFFDLQVIISIFEDGSPAKVTASLSRNGVAVSTNNINVYQDQSQAILLKVPPDTSGKEAKYKLRVEGKTLPLEKGGTFERYRQGFIHEKILNFTHDFLSITIRYLLRKIIILMLYEQYVWAWLLIISI